MELTLRGFENWAIDTAHGKNGKRWVDVYRKTKNNWEQFGHFDSLDEALDSMVADGIGMTEDQIQEIQWDIPGNIYRD